MISQCANPDCGTTFEYGTGRLFRFHHAKGEGPANAHSVQHFWLCELCAESFKLEYRKGQAVLIPIHAHGHAAPKAHHAHN